MSTVNVNVLDSKPYGTVTAPGGPFAHLGPQPATVQLQRQQEGSKAPTWWIRYGVIETASPSGQTDSTAYGGAHKCKSKADAEAAFARIPAREA